jgi:hypothetical protein
VTFVDAKQPDRLKKATALEIASFLGLNESAKGPVAWDVYEAVLAPGDVILMMVWKRASDADRAAKSFVPPENGRLRHVRVVRDYGMFDRREAPQYYATIER